MDDNVNDEVEVDGSLGSRRDLLKKAAVGGAVVWVAPAVLAGTASAQASPPIVPNPPGCEFTTVAPNWNTIIFNQGDNPVKRFQGPIGATGWTGNNADVVNGAYNITPPWIAPNNWIDVVGLGTSGNITTTFTVPCTGTYELRFRYSRYIGNATVSTSVNGHNNGPFAAPAINSPATFAQQYTLTAGTSVTVTISGTAASANQGAAVNNITFSLITP